MPAFDRYKDNLINPRPPGTGCHGWIMSTANLGAIFGKDPNEIFDDIRQAIPSGNRPVRDNEISDAIKKAMAAHRDSSFTPRPRPTPVVQDGPSVLQKIINQGKIANEVDLWEASPIKLWDEPQNDPVLLLESLYEPDAIVFIGNRHQSGIIGETIRTSEEWKVYFENGGKTAPHIILNPLNGSPTLTKMGNKTTFRGDNNISAYRYCLAEFDNLSWEDQLKFWSAVKLPIVALLHSGGKSIHAWLDVQKLATVTTPEEWQSKIKGHLYDRLLTPLGVDSACSNPARLSRLPGHYREEKGKFQKLLWLSPEGKTVC